MRMLLVGILLLAGQTGASLAQNEPAKLQSLREAVLALPGRKYRNEQLSDTLHQVLVKVDRNGNGIEIEEIATGRNIAQVARRAGDLARAAGTVMQSDLDNDGRVTREELQKLALLRVNTGFPGTTPEEMITSANKRAEQNYTRWTAQYDGNGDGVIELMELRNPKFADEGERKQIRDEAWFRLAEALMVFDRNGDKALSEVEGMLALAAAFDNFKPDCVEVCGGN